MPRLQALVFDLDGTILDSAPDLRQAMNATLAAYKRRNLSLDEVKAMTGDGLLFMMKRAFAATGEELPDADTYPRFQEFVAHYRDMKPDPAQIYPRVVETLTSFQSSGIKLGLCTNKQEEATVKLLQDLDLKRFFGFVAGGDTFLVHKPHPDHVLGVLKELGVPAENAVVIGDSSRDVAAAHAAKMKCLAVSHGYGGAAEGLGADMVLGSFDELKPALAKLGFEGF